MSGKPNINNEPDLLKIKIRGDEIKNLKYRTENHNHEKILKSPQIDNENYKKKYKNSSRKRKFMIVSEI